MSDRRAYTKEYYQLNKDRILSYQRDHNRKTGYASIKKYLRKYRLKQKYGLSLEEYDTMLLEQNGCCAICGTDTPGGNGRFHVDHCHSSNRVRGLLCARCNIGLGFFRDNTVVLARAIEYLASFDEQEEFDDEEEEKPPQ